MRLARAVVREAIASARSGPVASMLTVIMIAGMIFTIMITTGRTVGAEDEVLHSIDSAGTRTILIRADPGSGLNADVLTRVSTIDGIQWAGAFSAAVDGTNSRVPEGTRVPVRFAYATDLHSLGLPERPALPLAYASSRALDLLGLPDVSGSVTLTDGVAIGVGGRLTPPDYLAEFEPLVLVPGGGEGASRPVSLVAVIVAKPELLGAVSTAVRSLLAVEDPAKVRMETSADLAKLRGLIGAQLGSFSRQLILVLLAVTGALVAVILFGLVAMRRKDFGRRRALGASRGLIVCLLLTQTAVLAICAVVLGGGLAAIVLAVLSAPLPGPSFTIALAILTLVTSVAAALAPAIAGSRREPIRELRVP